MFASQARDPNGDAALVTHQRHAGEISPDFLQRSLDKLVRVTKSKCLLVKRQTTSPLQQQAKPAGAPLVRRSLSFNSSRESVGAAEGGPGRRTPSLRLPETGRHAHSSGTGAALGTRNRHERPSRDSGDQATGLLASLLERRPPAEKLASLMRGAGVQAHKARHLPRRQKENIVGLFASAAAARRRSRKPTTGGNSNHWLFGAAMALHLTILMLLLPLSFEGQAAPLLPMPTASSAKPIWLTDGLLTIGDADADEMRDEPLAGLLSASVADQQLNEPPKRSWFSLADRQESQPARLFAPPVGVATSDHPQEKRRNEFFWIERRRLNRDRALESPAWMRERPIRRDNSLELEDARERELRRPIHGRFVRGRQSSDELYNEVLRHLVEAALAGHTTLDQLYNQLEASAPAGSSGGSLGAVGPTNQANLQQASELEELNSNSNQEANVAGGASGVSSGNNGGNSNSGDQTLVVAGDEISDNDDVTVLELPNMSESKLQQQQQQPPLMAVAQRLTQMPAELLRQQAADFVQLPTIGAREQVADKQEEMASSGQLDSSPASGVEQEQSFHVVEDIDQADAGQDELPMPAGADSTASLPNQHAQLADSWQPTKRSTEPLQLESAGKQEDPLDLLAMLVRDERSLQQRQTAASSQPVGRPPLVVQMIQSGLFTRAQLIQFATKLRIYLENSLQVPRGAILGLFPINAKQLLVELDLAKLRPLELARLADNFGYVRDSSSLVLNWPSGLDNRLQTAGGNPLPVLMAILDVLYEAELETGGATRPRANEESPPPIEEEEQQEVEETETDGRRRDFDTRTRWPSAVSMTRQPRVQLNEHADLGLDERAPLTALAAYVNSLAEALVGVTGNEQLAVRQQLLEALQLAALVRQQQTQQLASFPLEGDQLHEERTQAQRNGTAARLLAFLQESSPTRWWSQRDGQVAPANSTANSSLMLIGAALVLALASTWLLIKFVAPEQPASVGGSAPPAYKSLARRSSSATICGKTSGLAAAGQQLGEASRMKQSHFSADDSEAPLLAAPQSFGRRRGPQLRNSLEALVARCHLLLRGGDDHDKLGRSGAAETRDGIVEKAAQVATNERQTGDVKQEEEEASANTRAPATFRSSTSYIRSLIEALTKAAGAQQHQTASCTTQTSLSQADDEELDASSASNSSGERQRRRRCSQEPLNEQQDILTAQMDISAAHLILDYMEKHLVDKERLRREWLELNGGAANCGTGNEPKRSANGRQLILQRLAPTALLEENAAKNRNANVLPFDRNRVKLAAVDAERASDYVNASFIYDADPRRPTHIVAQGPTAATCADFWQMIWEQEVSVIVNLTRLFENGEQMCHCYWPADVAGPSSMGRAQGPRGSVTSVLSQSAALVTANGQQQQLVTGGEPTRDNVLTFEVPLDEKLSRLEVHLISEHVSSSDYLVRNMYLINRATGETRTISQFHYLAWPVGRTPDNVRNFLQFRRKVHKSYRNLKRPILVHCNDGAGRSGTYALIDLILERIKNGAKEIDLRATLEHLREQRVGLCETQSQFEFVLVALAEEIQIILNALPQ